MGSLVNYIAKLLVVLVTWLGCRFVGNVADAGQIRVYMEEPDTTTVSAVKSNLLEALFVADTSGDALEQLGAFSGPVRNAARHTGAGFGAFIGGVCNCIRSPLKKRVLSFMTRMDNVTGISPRAARSLFVVAVALSGIAVLLLGFGTIYLLCFRDERFNVTCQLEEKALQLFEQCNDIQDWSRALGSTYSKQDDGSVSEVSGSEAISSPRVAPATSWFMVPPSAVVQKRPFSTRTSAECLGRRSFLEFVRFVDSICAHGSVSTLGRQTLVQELKFRAFRRTAFAYSKRRRGLSDESAGSAGSSKNIGSDVTKVTAAVERPSSLPKVPRSVIGNHKFLTQSVVSNKPLPKQDSSYLEIGILSLKKKSSLSIGLSPKIYPCFTPPGQCLGSLAYCCSDGILRKEGCEMDRGCEFGAGDQIGLLATRGPGGEIDCHFFRNGELQHCTSIPKEWPHEPHICIGVSGQARLMFNFGTAPLVFPPASSLSMDHYAFGEGYVHGSSGFTSHDQQWQDDDVGDSDGPLNIRGMLTPPASRTVWFTPSFIHIRGPREADTPTASATTQVGPFQRASFFVDGSAAEKGTDNPKDRSGGTGA